ncbi:MAG: hypothetical protein HWE23_00380 [Rhodobacteraceae bacterium]|nr:hypothetical protein [Paracoccaceae bacterium]
MGDMDRLLEWLAFFDGIRSPEPQNHAMAVAKGLLSSKDVFKKLHPGYTGVVKCSSVIYFKDFDLNSAPIFKKVKDVSRLDQYYYLDFAVSVFECCGQVYIPDEFKRVGEFENTEIFQVYISIYSSLRTMRDSRLAELGNEAASIKDKLTQNLILQTEKSAELVKADALHILKGEIQEERKNISQELADAAKKLKETAVEEIEKYKREAGATLVVKNADTLWREKTKSHFWSFFLGAITFVILISVTIALPLYHWERISAEILKLDKLFEGHVIGATILILIPVLGVAWVLRLVSRFTTQNMMLADDAQLRRVMAETYVKLVSNDAIKDPEDRAIILSALFRPLPGTSAEEISPPTIADILKTK